MADSCVGGHGVDVDAVEAVLDHLAAGLNERWVSVVVFGQPGVDEFVAEVARGDDQECCRAHGDVGHLEREDLLAAHLP